MSHSNKNLSYKKQYRTKETKYSEETIVHQMVGDIDHNVIVHLERVGEGETGCIRRRAYPTKKHLPSVLLLHVPRLLRLGHALAAVVTAYSFASLPGPLSKNFFPFSVCQQLYQFI